MYEGMPVIEASDSKGLEKKLAKLESRPEKYVVRISNRSTKIKASWATPSKRGNECSRAV